MIRSEYLEYIAENQPYTDEEGLVFSFLKSRGYEVEKLVYTSNDEPVFFYQIKILVTDGNNTMFHKIGNPAFNPTDLLYELDKYLSYVHKH
jgi:hypothetical protein